MSTERLKKFTILHSNDMHGDFLAESMGAQGRLLFKIHCRMASINGSGHSSGGMWPHA